MGGLLQCEIMHQYWDLLTPACRCSSFCVSAEQTTKGCGMCSSMPQYLTPPYSCRCSSYVSAEQTTEASGIRSLVPLAAIDDYVFEPCGYSMNSQEGRTFSTIHITPEAGFSYASFEISCFAAGSVDVQHLVARLSELFIPGEHLVCGVVCCAVPAVILLQLSGVHAKAVVLPTSGAFNAEQSMGGVELQCVCCWHDVLL